MSPNDKGFIGFEPATVPLLPKYQTGGHSFYFLYIFQLQYFGNMYSMFILSTPFLFPTENN